MERKLKVGDSFEVVEVLKCGGWNKLFKIGGFTIGVKYGNGIECIPNGYDTSGFQPLYMSNFMREIKPIGKLTITKLK